MFENIGLSEILIIVLIVVVLFGGKKIPELAQGIGKGIKEFKKALKDDEPAAKSTAEEQKVIEKKLD